MIISSRLKPFLVFVVSGLWLALFQSWGKFSDPDGFYHAKMALLVAERGPIQSFPWLNLTTLGQHFADQHFLYHVALIPFVKLFGGLWGTQIAAVFFSALFVTVFYLVLRALRAPAPWIWTALLLVLPHVLFRLTWAKATPLALVCFALGMMCLIRRKPWLAFGIGVIYSLMHGGWVLLIGCQVLFLFGKWVTEHMAFDERFTRRSFRDALPLLATMFGIGVGLLLHPNASAELSFLWTQVIQVGVATPYGHVIMGNEWYPPQIDDLIQMLALPMIALTVVGFGLLVARREPLDRKQAVLGTALLVAASGPFALLLKSIRFLEYVLPLLVLAIAALADLVDWNVFVQRVRELLPKLATPVLIVALLAFTVRMDVNAWHAIHDSGLVFGRFNAALSWLDSQAQSGDRIYESNWDVFPELFYGIDRVHFVSGLDPTFLYKQNPELSDGYLKLTQGDATSTAYHVIRDLAGASFVFLDRRASAKLEGVIRTDSRFEEGYSDESAYIFRVR
ncbi:MAG: hypothetical protein WCK01_03845 [Candidatus Uhrbacteria bacterium]